MVLLEKVMKNFHINYKPRINGFTLVELLIAITVFTVIITIITGILISALRVYRNQISYNDAFEEVKEIMTAIQWNAAILSKGTSFYCTGYITPNSIGNPDPMRSCFYPVANLNLQTPNSNDLLMSSSPQQPVCGKTSNIPLTSSSIVETGISGPMIFNKPSTASLIWVDQLEGIGFKASDGSRYFYGWIEDANTPSVRTLGEMNIWHFYTDLWSTANNSNFTYPAINNATICSMKSVNTTPPVFPGPNGTYTGTGAMDNYYSRSRPTKVRFMSTTYNKTERRKRAMIMYFEAVDRMTYKRITNIKGTYDTGHPIILQTALTPLSDI